MCFSYVPFNNWWGRCNPGWPYPIGVVAQPTRLKPRSCSTLSRVIWRLRPCVCWAMLLITNWWSWLMEAAPIILSRNHWCGNWASLLVPHLRYASCSEMASTFSVTTSAKRLPSSSNTFLLSWTSPSVAPMWCQHGPGRAVAQDTWIHHDWLQHSEHEIFSWRPLSQVSKGYWSYLCSPHPTPASPISLKTGSECVFSYRNHSFWVPFKPKLQTSYSTTSSTPLRPIQPPFPRTAILAPFPSNWSSHPSTTQLHPC